MIGCTATVRQTGPGTEPNTPAAPVEPAATPPAFAGVVEPPEAGAFIGVYHPPAPFEMASLESYARISDKPPAILMWYQPWADSGPNRFDAAAAVSVYQAGAIPMVTWEPWDPGKDANFVVGATRQKRFALKRIVDGKFDPYIRQFAQDVKSVRGPVMIRLMHEMNGNWYPWCGSVNGNSPEQFVKAWRHVHDLFEEEGADNVTWVWSINHESVPGDFSNRYGAYYPGDKYVDWTAMSGFNWGTTSHYSVWQPFTHWYKKPLRYLKTLGKPTVIAEFGVVEQGGDKAKWITDAYKRIRKDHPEVRAVIYYDALEKGPQNTQNWRISSSKTAEKAYREALANDYFVPGPSPQLDLWLQSLTIENERYLKELPPIY
jgi:hypothetical protein